MKKQTMITIIVIAIIAIIAIVGVVIVKNNNNTTNGGTSVKIESGKEMKSMLKSIYSENKDVLPELETEEIDVSNSDLVTSYTGIQSTGNVESLVVLEPLMSSQAYSAVALKVKSNANIETVKEEIFGNKAIDNSILDSVMLDESILDKNPFDLDDLLLPRVIMATMLVNDPDIILVNNIFSKLSDSNKKILRDLLKRLQFDFKKLVIIADPDVDLLFEISDVSLILDDTIIAAGNKFDIFANNDLLKNYNIDIPHYIEFKDYVKEKKDVDLLYRDRITDIIKDVYDNV